MRNKATHDGIQGCGEKLQSPPQDHPGNVFSEENLEVLRVMLSICASSVTLMRMQRVISPLVSEELSVYMTPYIAAARQDMGSIELAFRSEIERCNGVISDHAQTLNSCVDENVSLLYMFRSILLK